jgi:hypothetical protein
LAAGVGAHVAEFDAVHRRADLDHLAYDLAAEDATPLHVGASFVHVEIRARYVRARDARQGIRRALDLGFGPIDFACAFQCQSSRVTDRSASCAMTTPLGFRVEPEAMEFGGFPADRQRAARLVHVTGEGGRLRCLVGGHTLS